MYLDGELYRGVNDSCVPLLQVPSVVLNEFLNEL